MRKSSTERGNQVRNLSDPVTVTEERISESIVHMYEKERGAMSLEPGNLLGMARLNFRVKCNNQLRWIRSFGVLSAFIEGRHFLWNAPVLYELYMIKWQAILLRIYSFPPRTHERIFFYPGVASLPLINFKCMICEKYCNEFSMLCYVKRNW